MQYTDTMDYLKDFLADRLPGKRIACYFGDGGLCRGSDDTWAKCKKEEIKRDLKLKKIDLLICTDAAGEGLNLQFCGVLVNYDLPWNPMKVEQRIGRIDRIGQVHSHILIVNFAYEDTVEADVYFKVGQRINLFQGIIGKLQPILSRLPKKFEEYTLGAAENRDEARCRLQSDLADLEREAREPGFDIDASATENMEAPSLPASPVTLEDIDQIAQSRDFLPNALQWRPLDGCSYGALLPGMKDEIRVTTSGNVFSDYSDSQAIFSPAGELFEQVRALVAPETDDHSRYGVCWLVKRDHHLQLLLANRYGTQAVSSWEELRRLLDETLETAQLRDEFEIIRRIV